MEMSKALNQDIVRHNFGYKSEPVGVIKVLTINLYIYR